MAKTQVVKWSDFFSREVSSPKEQTPIDVKKVAKKCLPVAATVLAGLNFALHGDLTAFASVPTSINEDAIYAFANASNVEFAEKLRIATKPIRDIIMSFGHEIYGVMMLWGGIEALIGKFQQGVQRMKASTIAYILLVWVPWIVDTVSATVPH